MKKNKKMIMMVLICSLLLLSITGCSNSNSSTGFDSGSTHTIDTEVVTGGGRIETEPNKDSYQKGTTVEINAIAEDNYTFIEWTGALSGNNNPEKIVVDESLIIGAKFASSDELVEKPVTEWEYSRDANAIAINDNGYVYIARANSVKKFSPNGDELWTFDAPYTGGGDHIHDVGLDDEGNVYCSTGSSSSDYFYVMKISPSGEKLWFFKDHSDSVRNIAVTKDGYVYSASDGVIKKISPKGEEVWTFDNDYPYITELTLGKDEHIYASIKYYSTDIDDFLIKVSPEGKEEKIWDHFTRISSLAVDDYIYYGCFDQDSFPIVKKMSFEGEQIWSYKTHSNNMTSIRDLTVDDEGNVYSASGIDDVYLEKISPNGEEIWVYEDYEYTDGYYENVEVDNKGNVYTAESNKVKKISISYETKN